MNHDRKIGDKFSTACIFINFNMDGVQEVAVLLRVSSAPSSCWVSLVATWLQKPPEQVLDYSQDTEITGLMPQL